MLVNNQIERRFCNNSLCHKVKIKEETYNKLNQEQCDIEIKKALEKHKTNMDQNRFPKKIN